MTTQPPAVLLTRPKARSAQVAAELRAAGYAGDILISPLQRIDAVPAAPPAAGTALILTSAAAVGACPPAWMVGRRVLAVGPATAAAASAAGAEPETADGDVESLITMILANPPTGPLLHLRGAHVAGDLLGRLKEAGIKADARVVYRQTALPLMPVAHPVIEAAETGRHVIAPAYSQRSARLLANEAGPRARSLHLVALSEAVAAYWPEGGRVTVADAPNGPAMQDAILRCVAE